MSDDVILYLIDELAEQEKRLEDQQKIAEEQLEKLAVDLRAKYVKGLDRRDYFRNLRLEREKAEKAEKEAGKTPKPQNGSGTVQKTGQRTNREVVRSDFDDQGRGKRPKTAPTR